MNTKEVLDKIFKDPKTKYELSEFVDLPGEIHDIISIYPKTITSGREAGKIKYYMESFAPFSSGRTEVQVYSEDGKGNPEEIVRQLWVYKLINMYGYKKEEIVLEKEIQFGTEVGTKAADIVVYTDNTLQTPKIIIEVKKPKRKDGIEQLKSYLNAEGSPVGLWSNGSDRVILYRPYPKDFDDTLFDLPRRDQEPKDVLEAPKTILHLKNNNFNFKEIVQQLEELVLADSGVDEFNEIFKLIFAKIWDEKEAEENRANKVVEFRKSADPQITYERINNLFKKACNEWQGIFKEGEDIELRKDHLQICVGPIEGVRLMGSNLRIMDDAFEYLLPTEAKKKKGQFFTPRHVVEMCVRMLNPKKTEYVMDPSCGSGGFLLHAMDWCYPAKTNDERELRKHRYAAKYLWGIDFELRAAKTSRALMLIAGDGHTNIFGPDVSSLDPKTWYETKSGQDLMHKLVTSRLISKPIAREDETKIFTDEDLAWHYFDDLKFDVILANPPFAGEMKDKKMLAHYELAKPALKRAKDKQAKEERDVLFIERIIKFLKPGGRAAIVLPQGKFNNASLAFIREWLLRKARLLAVVGLHTNTFKPHTGTKTSVLFIQKYTAEQLGEIEKIQSEVAENCPKYEDIIKEILESKQGEEENLEDDNLKDISEDDIPDDILELINELFIEQEEMTIENEETSPDSENNESDNDEEINPIEKAEQELAELKARHRKARNELINLDADMEALEETNKQELDVLVNTFEGTKKELTTAKKELTSLQKEKIKKLKAKQKDLKTKLTKVVNLLENEIENAEFEIKKLTYKGRLTLLLQDEEYLGMLKTRWIDSEVSKRLDYPIFMAVSEEGGKNNSGDYEFVLNEEGNLVEFSEGHPQAGQPVIKQDLVNFNLTVEQLLDIDNIPDEELCIAEAFIRFAKRKDVNFDFWR